MTADKSVNALFGTDADGDGHLNTDGTECDDNCATCIVGSTHFTLSPDGLDHDCDGVVDDSHQVDSGARTNIVKVSDPKVAGTRVAWSARSSFCRRCMGRDLAWGGISFLCDTCCSVWPFCGCWDPRLERPSTFVRRLRRS